MKHSARFLSLLLAVLMLAVCFTACKSDDQNDPKTDNQSPDLSQTDSWTDDQWLAYEQSLDFGGRTFTLTATYKQVTCRKPDTENPTLIDTEMDELFRQLEKDLNIVINVTDTVSVDPEDLATYIMGGDSPADIYDQRPQNWLSYAAQGALFDWGSDEAKSYGVNVNNEKLFWQDWTHAWDIKGATYGVRYASKFYPPEAGWIMLYNEDLLAANGISNLEEKVRSGEWTWDYFLECAKACTKDDDGDGVPDTYGISTGYAAYGEEVVAGGAMITKLQDGRFVCTLNTPEVIEGLNFLVQQKQSGAIMPGVGSDKAAGVGYDDGHLAFTDGKVAFLYTELRIIAKKAYNADAYGMRQTEVTWGVLPIPVKAGEPYRNIIGNHDLDIMLMTNKQRDFAVKVYAAFARRQNDVNWKDCVAESYLQDPNDENKADILANYVIPNVTANWQWATGDANGLYRKEVVYPLYDDNASPANVAENVAPKIQALLDALPTFVESDY